MKNYTSKINNLLVSYFQQRLAEVYRAGAAYETALEYYMEALEEEVTPDLLFGSAYAAFQIRKIRNCY